jgi:hypothetical protein
MGIDNVKYWIRKRKDGQLHCLCGKYFSAADLARLALRMHGARVRSRKLPRKCRIISWQAQHLKQVIEWEWPVAAPYRRRLCRGACRLLRLQARHLQTVLDLRTINAFLKLLHNKTLLQDPPS